MSKYRQLGETCKKAIKIGILSLALPNPLLGGDFYNQYNSGIMGNKATVKQETTSEKKPEQKPEVVKDKPTDKKPSPPISKVNDEQLVGKSQEIIMDELQIPTYYVIPPTITYGTTTINKKELLTMSISEMQSAEKRTQEILKTGKDDPYTIVKYNYGDFGERHRLYNWELKLVMTNLASLSRTSDMYNGPIITKKGNGGVIVIINSDKPNVEFGCVDSEDLMALAEKKGIQTRQLRTICAVANPGAGSTLFTVDPFELSICFTTARTPIADDAIGGYTADLKSLGLSLEKPPKLTFRYTTDIINGAKENGIEVKIIDSDWLKKLSNGIEPKFMDITIYPSPSIGTDPIISEPKIGKIIQPTIMGMVEPSVVSEVR